MQTCRGRRPREGGGEDAGVCVAMAGKGRGCPCQDIFPRYADSDDHEGKKKKKKHLKRNRVTQLTRERAHFNLIYC